MFKRRKMRLNGEWSLLGGNRAYELIKHVTALGKARREAQLFEIFFKD
jgi:hypothetical protein